MKSDFNILASIATNPLHRNIFEEKIKRWADSPFKYILSLSSRQKGKIGEDLLSEFLIQKGCQVEKTIKTDYDRLINGHKCEIKMSTLWKNGRYVFQQIRSTEWDYLLCLGLSPKAAHLWYAKRDIIGYLGGQHTGHRGTDTRWLHIMPDEDPLPVPNLFGGELSKGISSFLKEIGVK